LRASLRLHDVGGDGFFGGIFGGLVQVWLLFGLRGCF